MTAGCLGPHEAKMHFNGRTWSTQFIPGVTTKTVDSEAQARREAEDVFPQRRSPSVLRLGRAGKKQKSRRRGRCGPTRRAERTGGSGGYRRREKGGEEKIKEPYVDKAKGVKQTLWERGWYVHGISTSEKAPSHMRLDTFVGHLPDFKNEISTLQQLCTAAGTFFSCRQNSTRRSSIRGGCRNSSFGGRSTMKFRSICTPTSSSRCAAS